MSKTVLNWKAFQPDVVIRRHAFDRDQSVHSCSTSCYSTKSKCISYCPLVFIFKQNLLLWGINWEVSLSLVFGVHSKTKAQCKVELFNLLSTWSKLQDPGEIISVLSVPVKNVPTNFFIVFSNLCSRRTQKPM